MNPLTSIIKAAAYLQGWLAGQNLPKHVVEVINTLIDAVEKPINQYRQPITLEDDDIEHIAALIIDRLESKQHTETKVDVEPEEKTKPDEFFADRIAKVREAVLQRYKTGLLPNLYGPNDVRCFRCKNYSARPKKGGKYRFCEFYEGIGIKAPTVDRSGKCLRYEKATTYPVPLLKCSSCTHYDKGKKHCTFLEIQITAPNRNMHDTCPYWYHGYGEPMDFSYYEKRVVKRVEEMYEKINR